MRIAFIKNAYNKSQIANDKNSNTIEISFFDKFALKTLNKLTYNHKINCFFVVNILLNLPNYYTLSYDVKSINIGILYNQFSELALSGYNQGLNKNNVM